MSLPKTMKAVVLFGQGDMRLVDVYPVPQPGPEEVIIKVEACAICGTDPKILAEGWPNHPFWPRICRNNRGSGRRGYQIQAW